MNRHFPVLMVLILALLSMDGMSQKWKLRRYEALAGVGTTHYFGTIGGSAEQSNLFGLKDIDITSTRPSFYGGIRYKLRDNVAVRGNFLYGFIHGDDAGSKNVERNAVFNSTIMEPSLQLEISLISEEQKHRSAALFNKRGMVNNFSRINLYGFGGLGGVFTNVKPLNDLEKHASYDPVNLKNNGLVILGGGGLKYVLSSDLSLGFEFGARYTTSKYLDGLHPLTAKAPDMYYFALFNVVYRVRTSRTGAPILFRRTPGGMF